MATVTGKNLHRAHPLLRQGLDELADTYNTDVWCQSVGRTDAEQKYLYDGFKAGKPGFNPANPPGIPLSQGGSWHRFVEGKQMALAADITPGAGKFGWNPGGRLHAPIRPREPWHFQLESIPAQLWVPGDAPISVIKLGDSGASVKAIQGDLQYVTGQKLEVRPGVFDGQFGPATNHVVIFFQKREGLLADGRVGPTTRNRLTQRVLEKLFADRFKYNRYANITRILGEGSKGDDVKRLQDGLIAIGQDIGIADGSFGGRTLIAVQNIQRLAWQDSEPDKVDGAAGPETLQWLDFLLDNAGK